MHPKNSTNGNGVPHRWHRIRTIREREGISLKTISRRSRIGMQRLRQEEDETRDLSLSQLYAWQQALRVPISELVVDAEEALEWLDRRRLRGMSQARSQGTYVNPSAFALLHASLGDKNMIAGLR